MKEKKEELEFKLFSSTNEYEINQICAALEEKNIPYVRRDYGSGSYMNIYMGQSFQEKSVFVSSLDYNKSLEIISSLIIKKPIKSNDEERIEDEYTKKHLLARKIFKIWNIGVSIFLMILMIIMTIKSLIQN